jgi:hypothetical protein
MIEKCDPLRRCWDDWWDKNIRLRMMDQLSLGVISGGAADRAGMVFHPAEE